jgi:hypothetical protein
VDVEGEGAYYEGSERDFDWMHLTPANAQEAVRQFDSRQGLIRMPKRL